MSSDVPARMVGKPMHGIDLETANSRLKGFNGALTIQLTHRSLPGTLFETVPVLLIAVQPSSSRDSYRYSGPIIPNLNTDQAPRFWEVRLLALTAN
eukprot:2155651-Rhodomonas_salina.1